MIRNTIDDIVSCYDYPICNSYRTLTVIYAI